MVLNNNKRCPLRGMPYLCLLSLPASNISKPSPNHSLSRCAAHAVLSFSHAHCKPPHSSALCSSLTVTLSLKYKLKRKAFLALTGLFAFRSIFKRRCNGLPIDKCPTILFKSWGQHAKFCNLYYGNNCQPFSVSISGNYLG